MKRQIAVLSIVIFLLFSFPLYASTPLAAVQDNVNKVLEVLRDPKLKPESAKEIKKTKLLPIYERMFDDIELSKRTLAKNWNSMNAAQRKEFVELFRQVLAKAYIDKILAYTNEKIVFDRETGVTGSRAEVQTRIITSSTEIPISYRVILKGSDWKVYDVVIENVSLVLNYRTQFNDILAKNPIEQLLATLRKKVKEQ